MKPKEKAIQLVDNFRLNVEDYEGSGLNLFKAKQCALIAVNELISSHNKWDDYAQTNSEEYYYWQEVKQEIELL